MSGEALSEVELRRLFEAARWAPSCANAQPWHFIVVTEPQSIRQGVARVTEHADLYRAGVGRIHNRAVFEIPDVLESILAKREGLH